MTVSQQLTLTFSGDLMGHFAATGMSDYGPILEDLKPWLHTDDLTFVNLETPMDDNLPLLSGPRFNVHSGFVRAAIEAGVDVFSLANNHAADHGVGSLVSTLEGMKALRVQYGIHFAGLGGTWSPEVFEKNGFMVGFVAATSLLNQSAGSELVNLVNPAAAEGFFEHLRQLRSRVDILILSFHGGDPYRTETDPGYLSFYLQCLQSGVDIVWGTHPHVLQTWYRVWMADRFRLILPSLGNLVSGQTQFLTRQLAASPRARTGDGALFRVIVRKDRGQIVLSVPQAVLVNTLVSASGVRVSPTRRLIDEGPAEWQQYYQRRWTDQQAWLVPRDILTNGEIRYSDSP